MVVPQRPISLLAAGDGNLLHGERAAIIEGRKGEDLGWVEDRLG